MHRSLERRRMEPAHAFVDDDLDLPGDELSETTVRAAVDEHARGRQHDVVRRRARGRPPPPRTAAGAARTAVGTRSPARRAVAAGCGGLASRPLPRRPPRTPSAHAREACVLSPSQPSRRRRARSRPVPRSREPRARASPRSRGTRPRRASRRSSRSAPPRAVRSRRRDRRTDAPGGRPPCGRASTCRRP